MIASITQTQSIHENIQPPIITEITSTPDVIKQMEDKLHLQTQAHTNEMEGEIRAQIHQNELTMKKEFRLQQHQITVAW